MGEKRRRLHERRALDPLHEHHGHLPHESVAIGAGKPVQPAHEQQVAIRLKERVGQCSDGILVEPVWNAGIGTYQRKQRLDGKRLALGVLGSANACP